MRTTKELAALVEAAPDWDSEVELRLGYRGPFGGEAVWLAEVEAIEADATDDVGEALAALLGALDRSTLRRLIAAADALTTIALAAGLGADATAEEVAQRVGEMARTLSLLGTWRAEHGAALKPSGADTYGDGMRDAKQQVGAILSRLAEEAGRDEDAAALGADMARMAALGEALKGGGRG